MTLFFSPLLRQTFFSPFFLLVFFISFVSIDPVHYISYITMLYHHQQIPFISFRIQDQKHCKGQHTLFADTIKYSSVKCIIHLQHSMILKHAHILWWSPIFTITVILGFWINAWDTDYVMNMTCSSKMLQSIHRVNGPKWS